MIVFLLLFFANDKNNTIFSCANKKLLVPLHCQKQKTITAEQ